MRCVIKSRKLCRSGISAIPEPRRRPLHLRSSQHLSRRSKLVPIVACSQRSGRCGHGTETPQGMRREGDKGDAKHGPFRTCTPLPRRQTNADALYELGIMHASGRRLRPIRVRAQVVQHRRHEGPRRCGAACAARSQPEMRIGKGIAGPGARPAIAQEPRPKPHRPTNEIPRCSLDYFADQPACPLAGDRDPLEHVLHRLCGLTEQTGGRVPWAVVAPSSQRQSGTLRSATTSAAPRAPARCAFTNRTTRSDRDWHRRWCEEGLVASVGRTSTCSIRHGTAPSNLLRPGRF